MTARLLHSLVRLFALIALSDEEKDVQRQEAFIVNMLRDYLPEDKIAPAIAGFRKEKSRLGEMLTAKKLSRHSVKALKISRDIARELPVREQGILLLRFTEYILEYAATNSLAYQLAELMSEVMHFPEGHYEDLKAFIGGTERSLPEAHYRQFFSAKLHVLYLDAEHVYVKANVPGVYLDASEMHRGRVYPFYYHHRLRYHEESISFLALRHAFIQDAPDVKALQLRDLSMSYKGHGKVIQDMSVDFLPASINAIMGPSGAGKSTLLRLIGGQKNPGTGSVHYVLQENAHLRPAYIPQEDSLIPELSLEKQLMYQLRFSGYKRENTAARARQILQDCGLIRHAACLPGYPAHSRLSGGERKRMAVALGLASLPNVLILDEPTSGLSFGDARELLAILRTLANRGIMIICSLHQPGGDILAACDRILYMDYGGVPVFAGPPDAIAGHVAECTGQVFPEIPQHRLFSSVEARIHECFMSESGVSRGERKYPPEFWQRHYRPLLSDAVGKKQCLRIQAKPAAGLGLKMLQRRLERLWNNRPRILGMLLYAPLMSALLSGITRYSEGERYVFADNPHFPVFLLMTVIVALFGGLVFFSGGLIHDRNFRKREHVNTGRNASFLNASAIPVILAGILQAILFVFPAQCILGFKGCMHIFIAVYALLFIFAGFTALFLSTLFRNAAMVYILIPFLLIPQLIFSGLLIPYDTMPLRGKHTDARPVSALCFVSHYAFDAMAVSAFMDNPYMCEAYKIKRQEKLSVMFLNYLLPHGAQMSGDEERSRYLQELQIHFPEPLLHELSQVDAQSAMDSIAFASDWFRHLHYSALAETPNNRSVRRYHNTYLEQVLRSTKDAFVFSYKNDVLNIYKEQIYRIPAEDKIAHPYAPCHRPGGILIKSSIFDVLVLALFSLIVFLVLRLNLGEYPKL